MYSRSRKIAAAIAAVGLTSSFTNLHAAIVTWTGLDGNPNWSDGNNWNPTAPPASTDQAEFNNSGNGQTTVNLGGSQSAGSINFDTGAAAYTIGAASDTLSLSGATGVVVIGASVTSSQAVNSSITLANSATFSNASAVGLTIGASPTTSALITLPSSGVLSLAGSNASSVITLNEAIQGSTTGGILLPASTSGTVVFNNGASTYGGTTTQTSPGAVTIQIGASTDTNNSATFTQGPFGKSTIVFNNTSNSPLQAIGADQTVANPLTLTFGFTVTNPAVGTPHNLTFTGPITLSPTNGRTITANNFGQVLTLGASPNSTTMTLPNSSGTTTNFAISAVNADGTKPATIIVNDLIQNGATAGIIGVASPNNNVPGGIVQFNGANTYTGGFNITQQSTGFIQGLTVQAGVSSVGTPGSLTSGPFGTGTIKWNGNSNSPGTLEPLGGDRIVGNAITLTSGFFVAEPTLAQDPTVSTPHSLTLSGVIGSDSKTMTNNLPAGAAMIYGLSSNPQTFVVGHRDLPNPTRRFWSWWRCDRLQRSAHRHFDDGQRRRIVLHQQHEQYLHWQHFGFRRRHWSNWFRNRCDPCRNRKCRHHQRNRRRHHRLNNRWQRRRHRFAGR